MNDPSRLQANLRHLYGARAEEALAELRELWAGHGLAATDAASGTEMGAPGGPAWIAGAGDVALIAYADSIRGSAGPPLAALRRFVRRYLARAINTLHLLPFFPWDTDRGFSVQDYRAVDARNGTWEDIEALAEEFSHLMVDLVINHASLDNPLVQGALTGDPRCRDFVIRYDDGAQPDAAALAALTRPRPFTGADAVLRGRRGRPPAGDVRCSARHRVVGRLGLDHLLSRTAQCRRQRRHPAGRS